MSLIPSRGQEPQNALMPGRPGIRKNRTSKGASTVRAVYGDLLLIGNAIEARNMRLLYDNEVRAVLDLAANEKPASLGRDHIYVRVPILDGDGNSDRDIELAIITLVHLMKTETKTLVACSAGMSRSPCVAAASIALASNRSIDECMRKIISAGPNDASPILWHHVQNVYDGIAESRLRGAETSPNNPTDRNGGSAAFEWEINRPPLGHRGRYP